MMNSFEMGQIIARAWADPGFKARLLRNPSEAIKECEIDLPSNLRLKVHTNSESEMHLVIPAPPATLDTLKPTINAADDDGGCWLPCRGNNSW